MCYHLPTSHQSPHHQKRRLLINENQLQVHSKIVIIKWEFLHDGQLIKLDYDVKKNEFLSFDIHSLTKADDFIVSDNFLNRFLLKLQNFEA
jgi:hypothetical protein